MNRRQATNVESRMKRAIASLFTAGLLAGCSAFGIRSDIEQPAYEVIDSPAETLEVRRYAPRVAAEATVEAEATEDGRNAAFRLLFDYISGANREAAKIAMTAPVETAEPGQEIAMTVPVETVESAGGQTRMRFFLPATYSRVTPPAPTDSRVRIVTLPEQTLAVLRFSGSRSEERIEAKSETLLAALRATDWRPTAEPVAQLYDPPWTLPFFRRNEVAVAVTQ